MNGPDHYREAERLLEEAESCEEPGSRALWCLELAKLHVTLAQVAATALNLTAANGWKSLAQIQRHEPCLVRAGQQDLKAQEVL